MFLACILCLFGISFAQDPPPLGQYNIDPNGISVSGLSSGGCMATQMHVAFSETFMGLGSVAGVFYYCGEDNTLQAVQCMNDNGGTVETSVSAVEDIFFPSGQIDDPEFLRNTRVYIIQGTNDDTVIPINADRIEQFYRDLHVNPSHIEVYTLNMGHAHPTENYGALCPSTTGPEYINRCEYHGSYEMLDFIYEGLNRPDDNTPVGDIAEFDQAVFYTEGTMRSISMDTVGFVYVPESCDNEDTQCRLHVALHGCNQGRGDVEDIYATMTFYNHVAELNNIIILYPQAISSLSLPTNPQGCWDWWGYNDGFADPPGHYASKVGPQMETIKNMIDHMMGIVTFP